MNVNHAQWNVQGLSDDPETNKQTYILTHTLTNPPTYSLLETGIIDSAGKLEDCFRMRKNDISIYQKKEHYSFFEYRTSVVLYCADSNSVFMNYCTKSKTRYHYVYRCFQCRYIFEMNVLNFRLVSLSTCL